MNIDPVELAKYFRDISDDELLHRCNDGKLTEVAQTIADAELAARGMKLPTPVTPQVENFPYEGDFETVTQLFNPTDAYVLAGCLEAAGIPTVVADTNLVQVHSLLAIAVGGVRIRVPATRIDEAKNVIAAFYRGDFALPDDDDSYRE
jgi:hypothetical protein